VEVAILFSISEEMTILFKYLPFQLWEKVADAILNLNNYQLVLVAEAKLKKEKDHQSSRVVEPE